MIRIKKGRKAIPERGKWAARGASLAAKAKATKAVWFPPKPEETGKKAASTAKIAARRVTRKSTGAARKPPSGTRTMTKPLRRKKA